ncbi:ABC transporter permease/M1 family aminopeptidase [Aquimarina algiphila]|nr:M1 family aminopeptidase [Aquimarina algiphila]
MMFKTFFLKEITRGLKQPMIYIFLFIFTIIAVIGVLNDDITFGGSVGTTLRNAPYVMTIYVANMSIFGLLIATTYFNNAALRDYQYNFDEILFSTSIHKAGYFFGRFFGALFLSTIPLLGVLIGFLIGTNMGFETGIIAENRLGELHFGAFINNYLLFILPNMFISGAIIFAIANTWKSTIISFIATTIIIIGYLLSGTFLNDISTENLAALTDILGIRAYTIDTKYLTGIQKNIEIVSFTGWLLVNRILWFSIGLIIIFGSYISFSFMRKNKKTTITKKRKHKTSETKSFNLPQIKSNFNNTTSAIQFISFFKINFYTLLKSNTFKIMLIFGALTLINKLINGFEYYGLQSYPVTYKILDFNRPISMILGMIMLVFFSGELVWRERTNKINGVVDSTYHHSFVLIISKIISLIVINIIFDLFLIFISIGYQLLNGYTNPEIGVYLLDFLYSGLPTYAIWSCILISIQILINHKYIAYFVSILLIFLIEFLVVDTLGISSYMVNLGFTPSYLYSDMNAFGAVLTAKNWFNLYWILFGVLLTIITSVFWVRGTISGFKNRLKTAQKYFTKRYILSLIVISVLFILTSSFVYYNTQVLNPYTSADDIENMQESYEKKYKQFEHIIQPKITSIQYEVDIYPNERNVKSKSYITLVNKSKKAIDSLHYTTTYFVGESNTGLELRISNWKKTIAIPNSKLVYNDTRLGYQIFKLNTSLLPNDTIHIVAETKYVSKGFENSVSNIRVAKNGTFLDTSHILPSFGYEVNNEITDANNRINRGLPVRVVMNSLKAKKDVTTGNYITKNLSDWVQIETTISTANDQIAVAPGSLIKQWSTKERSFFKYKSDHVSLNFTNFMSAKYEVASKKWNGIDIEVYHHKTHHYNIDMMLNAVEKSLTYFTENFGPYFHHQARIVEIPRYYNFAQAFPGTMPYTEGGGFITNLSNKNDNNIIYSIVAHEMAHQYWAHQVVGANVEGATMLSESFAEYSALMVMKKELNDDIKMKQYLAYDFEKYLKGRSRETEKENPLYKVKDQGYIHYGKGSLVLYALQDYLGEEVINEALREFLNDYKYKTAPYPTTLDFISYLESRIPDAMQYLVKDWLKEITLYDYRLKTATYTAKNNGKYDVSMSIEAHKIKVDSLGNEHNVQQHDWVDIGVYADADEKKLIHVKRVLFTDQNMSFTFEVDHIPIKAAIDPKRLLIERVIDDNVREVIELMN